MQYKGAIGKEKAAFMMLIKLYHYGRIANATGVCVSTLFWDHWTNKNSS